MKQLFYFCLFCLFFQSLSAQIVNIPDANFKAKLIALGVDTNSDGEIQNTEAEAVTYLDVSNSNISDMTGIEAFVNLITLGCYGNQLTMLNVSTLTYLEHLDCFYNQLSTLNYGTQLQSLFCDHNLLTSLDVSNLTNLQELHCNNNLLTNLSLNTCTNLYNLDCGYNQMTTLNVDGLNNLAYLSCEHNNALSTLSMNGCINLTVLNYSSCNLSNLNISSLSTLTTLYCKNNQITNLNLTALTNLAQLYCTKNQLTNLDVGNLSNLQTLACDSNQLTSLNANPSLVQLNCRNNQLSNLDITLFPNLSSLACSFNQIQQLNLSNTPGLQHLFCDNNLLDSLDITNLTSLTYLMCENNQLQQLLMNTWSPISVIICHHNQLTKLIMPNFYNLGWLSCNNNQLQTLDLGNSPNLYELHCDSNQLETFYIKNGVKEFFLSFEHNPDLGYICADTSQLADLQQMVAQYGMSNVIINPFCTFTPYVGYNTVMGNSKYDNAANACTANATNLTHLTVKVVNANSGNYFSTNSNGYYQVLIDSGTHTLTPQFENPSYFSTNPVIVSFPDNNFNAQLENFCIAANGSFSDVEISAIGDVFRPGFDVRYDLLFHNKGTTTASGDITLAFMGDKMAFVNASQAPITQTANQLTWIYSNLQPFETRLLAIYMHLFAPPINNIGDAVSFTSNISLQNEISPSDNVFTANQPIVGSFDPNDKTCLEGNLLNNDKIGDYLHYLIRFQNTGTFYAENVVVVDSIDGTKYDISSLQILETSHNGHIKVENDVLQFYFENIMLPDSFTDEPASHGYALFKIKTKANLPQNSEVKNKSEIYFDYNLPIITNTAITTFMDNVSLENGLQKPTFKCYPNPAQAILMIESEKMADFVILNVMGENVFEKKIQGKEKVDISGFAKGMYFLQATNTGIGQVFVKE